MKIVAKVKDDDSPETKPFYLNKAHTTLLKLDDKVSVNREQGWATSGL